MKYTVEFTCTIEVEAEDSIEAYEKAMQELDKEDLYAYVDGNLIN